MFTGNMLRRLFLGLVFVVAIALTGCGATTYSSSQSGFVDYGGQQPVVSGTTQYLPVQPNGYTTLPNRQIVPAQPGTMYPVTPVPQTTYGSVAGTTGNRVQSHHENQESSIMDAAGAFNFFTNGIYNLAGATAIISDVVSPWNDRRPRHRYWSRPCW